MFSSRAPDGYCSGAEAAARVQTAVTDDGEDDEVFYPSSMKQDNGMSQLGYCNVTPLYISPYSMLCADVRFHNLIYK